MDLLEMLVEMDKARTAYLDMKRTERILRAGGNDAAADRFQQKADVSGADWEKWFRACAKAAPVDMLAEGRLRHFCVDGVLRDGSCTTCPTCQIRNEIGKDIAKSH